MSTVSRRISKVHKSEMPQISKHVKCINSCCISVRRYWPTSFSQISTCNLSPVCVALFAPQQVSIGFGIGLIVSAIRTQLDARPSTDFAHARPAFTSDVIKFPWPKPRVLIAIHASPQVTVILFSPRIIYEESSGCVSRVASPLILQARPVSFLPPVAR